jgi:hypothetical protein
MHYCRVCGYRWLFDAGEGEGDEDVGYAELEVSGFTGSPVERPEDPACDLDPLSPVADDFGLVVRALEVSLIEPTDAPAGP